MAPTRSGVSRIAVRSRLCLKTRFYNELFSSAISAYLCDLCVNISRDYSYAEITEIRRDHREELLLFCFLDLFQGPSEPVQVFYLSVGRG